MTKPINFQINRVGTHTMIHPTKRSIPFHPHFAPGRKKHLSVVLLPPTFFFSFSTVLYIFQLDRKGSKEKKEKKPPPSPSRSAESKMSCWFFFSRTAGQSWMDGRRRVGKGRGTGREGKRREGKGRVAVVPPVHNPALLDRAASLCCGW